MPEFIHLHGVFGHGLCQCGCGQETSIAKVTVKRRGYVKGCPKPFVIGHYYRGEKIVEEDRGHTTPCWIWQKFINQKGYGLMFNPATRKMNYAHIIFYERERGRVPSGLELDHLCRVRSCVRPLHLEAVTHVENVRRGINCTISVETQYAVRSYFRPGMRQKDVGMIFGISQASVGRILRREMVEIAS